MRAWPPPPSGGRTFLIESDFVAARKCKSENVGWYLLNCPEYLPTKEFESWTAEERRLVAGAVDRVLSEFAAGMTGLFRKVPGFEGSRREKYLSQFGQGLGDFIPSESLLASAIRPSRGWHDPAGQASMVLPGDVVRVLEREYYDGLVMVSTIVGASGTIPFRKEVVSDDVSREAWERHRQRDYPLDATVRVADDGRLAVEIEDEDEVAAAVAAGSLDDEQRQLVAQFRAAVDDDTAALLAAVDAHVAAAEADPA